MEKNEVRKYVKKLPTGILINSSCKVDQTFFPMWSFKTSVVPIHLKCHYLRGLNLFNFQQLEGFPYFRLFIYTHTI